MTSLLITGTNGFVGKTLCREAAERGLRVRAATRTARNLEGSENMQLARLTASPT